MKGFTLIEILACMVLVTLLSLFAAPFIQNQIANNKQNINDTNLKIIYSATELYMDDNEVKKCSRKNDTYCVSLDNLVQNGYLKNDILNYTNGEKIGLNKYVKVTFNNYNDYVFKSFEETIVDSCEITVECN